MCREKVQELCVEPVEHVAEELVCVLLLVAPEPRDHLQGGRWW